MFAKREESKDVPRSEYEQHHIPRLVWEFFNSEEGLNTSMLLAFTNKLRQESVASMIGSFRSVTFPLVRYYRDTPGLTVQDLLQYNSYAIRDFAVHDKNFEFHKWLLKNNLTMPENLVNEEWNLIYYICRPEGIKYLNRRFSTCSKEELQSKFDQMINLGWMPFITDFNKVMADYLANKKITEESPTLWKKQSITLTEKDCANIGSAFESFFRSLTK
jgi:hypothetical protein